MVKMFQVGAVSTTGHGESITKVCLAHTAINLMEAGILNSKLCSYSFFKACPNLKSFYLWKYQVKYGGLEGVFLSYKC